MSTESFLARILKRRHELDDGSKESHATDDKGLQEAEVVDWSIAEAHVQDWNLVSPHVLNAIVAQVKIVVFWFGVLATMYCVRDKVVQYITDFVDVEAMGKSKGSLDGTFRCVRCNVLIIGSKAVVSWFCEFIQKNSLVLRLLYRIALLDTTRSAR